MSDVYIKLPVLGGDTIYANNIEEYTSGSGVTIDGILLRDSDLAASNIRLEGEEIAFYSTSEGRILFAGDYTFDDSVTLANDLKTMLNAHAADGAEHFQGGVPTPDTLYFPVTEANATDWDSLVALTYSLMWRYSSHADDGVSIGGGDFHNAQTPFTYQLTSTYPIITLYDIASMLNDIKLRYNQHEADAVGHTVGSAHTEINSDVPIYGLFAQGGWLGYRGLFFSPYEDSYTSLGYYSHAWKDLWLNNDTTDGGTIHFNGNYAGSSFIKSSADGLELKISGFDDAAFMFDSYCDGDILASPGSAIVLANSLKANINNHLVSRYGAHWDNDFVDTITEAYATHSLTDLIALIVDLMAGYTGHDTDATLGAGSLYHKNSAYAGTPLASLVAPTNFEECLTRLADIKAKYNTHEASAVAHYGTSLFTETHTAYNGDWVIGNSEYPFKSLTLNNDATDGGAIYFNASSTSFIKSSADGLTLNINGFDTLSFNNDVEFNFGAGNTLEINPTVWEDFVVPANAIKLAGGAAADEEPYKGGYILSFDDASDEYCFFNIQLPHDYAEGTDIELHIHWTIKTSGAGLGAENVKWVATYSASSPNLVTSESWPAETSDDETRDVQNDSAGDHLVAEIVTMSGTNFKISECIICSLYRDTTVANNYADEAYVISVDVHYQKNTLGSRGEWIK